MRKVAPRKQNAKQDQSRSLFHRTSYGELKSDRSVLYQERGG